LGIAVRLKKGYTSPVAQLDAAVPVVQAPRRHVGAGTSHMLLHFFTCIGPACAFPARAFFALFAMSLLYRPRCEKARTAFIKLPDFFSGTRKTAILRGFLAQLFSFSPFVGVCSARLLFCHNLKIRKNAAIELLFFHPKHFEII